VDLVDMRPDTLREFSLGQTVALTHLTEAVAT
jgi:hypothetical protein